MKTNILIYSEELTKEDLLLLLQAIRDCEQSNFSQKFIGIFVSAPELKTQEMEEIVRSVKPGFVTLKTFPTVQGGTGKIGGKANARTHKT